MAYQLLRTNTALTGNVQIHSFLTANGVTSMSLSPISSNTFSTASYIKYNTSTYGRDLVNFYTKYSNIFYNTPIPQHLNNSTGIINFQEDGYITNRVDYHEYGIKRCSKNIIGTTFNLFAPILIQNTDDIPDYVEISIQREDVEGLNIKYPEFKHKINIAKNVNGPLFTYLYNSLKDLGEVGSSIKMINISPASRESYIIGRSVADGNISNIKSDLPIYLYSNDQTWIEFDSRIINEYSRYKLVSPYIFNLSFCFNISDIFYNISGFVETGKSYKINARYYKDANVVDLYDFDTNHEYVYNATYTEDGEDVIHHNILDYNHEYKVSDIMNHNKQRMIPYITKWTMSNSNDKYIFNNCWGYEYSEYPLEGVNQQYGIKFRSKIEDDSINNTYWCELAREYDLFNSSGESISYSSSEVSYNILSLINGDTLDRYAIKDNIVLIRGVKYDLSVIDVLKDKINNDTLVSINKINIGFNNTNAEGYLYATSYNDMYIYIDIFICVSNSKSESINVFPTLSDLRNISFNISTGEYLGGYISDDYSDAKAISQNLYDCLTLPNYIYVNEPITSNIVEGTTDDWELLSNQNMNINIYRYGGWIYPRLLKLSNMHIENEYLYLYKKDNYEDSTIYSFINMGEFDDTNISNDGINDTYRDSMKATYDAFPDWWLGSNSANEISSNNNYIKNERRWFFDSTIMNMSDNITISCDYNSSGDNYIKDNCLSGLSEYYDTTDDILLDYIYKQYDMIVMRENDSLTYNIKLTLK